jgi:acid phosphatase
VKKIVEILIGVVALTTFAAAQVPKSSHVVMVLEENHSYGKIIGNSSMPYLNSLAQKYGLAINYYGNTHPSIGNYLMMTTGQIITNSDGWTGTVTSNNFVRAALTSGISWKSYAESLPSVGYTGGDKYPYVKHHNPFAYFSDVVNSSTEKNNIVPFTHFAQDLANHTLPKFSFVIPNMNHNMHDCPAGMSSCTDSQKAAAADSWLKTNIAPLLANSDFQTDGLLIITWDEGNSTDSAHGGGQVATVVIGPKVKKGYRSSTFYQEQSLLRTVLAAAGSTLTAPGAAASAPLMSDFFGASTTTSATCTMSAASPSVTICTPTTGATVSSPTQIVAGTTSSTTVNYMCVWVDGVKQYQAYANKINTMISMGPGTHRVTVQAKNSAGSTFSNTINVTVK